MVRGLWCVCGLLIEGDSDRISRREMLGVMCCRRRSAGALLVGLGREDVVCVSAWVCGEVSPAIGQGTRNVTRDSEAWRAGLADKRVHRDWQIRRGLNIRAKLAVRGREVRSVRIYEPQKTCF